MDGNGARLKDNRIVQIYGSTACAPRKWSTFPWRGTIPLARTVASSSIPALLAASAQRRPHCLKSTAIHEPPIARHEPACRARRQLHACSTTANPVSTQIGMNLGCMIAIENRFRMRCLMRFIDGDLPPSEWSDIAAEAARRPGSWRSDSKPSASPRRNWRARSLRPWKCHRSLSKRSCGYR